MEEENISTPDSWNTVIAEFASPLFEFNFPYLVAFSGNNNAFTIRTKGAFGFVAPDIADIDIIESFIKSHPPCSFQSRYRGLRKIF
ncbi:MAG: hypothetical protein V3U91_06230, partial [Candidatus Aminicenantaceae bacterium]